MVRLLTHQQAVLHAPAAQSGPRLEHRQQDDNRGEKNRDVVALIGKERTDVLVVNDDDDYGGEGLRRKIKKR